MPEGRAFPYKYLPRLGKHLSVTFGAPLDPRELKALRATAGNTDAEIAQTRIAVTAAVHRAVEALGHTVSGPLLTRIPE